MPRKRIVFVIVEGPSDEEALGVLLNRFFDSNTVYIHVMHSDITSELDVSPDNIVAKIGNTVRTYAGKIFKQTDFGQIIHITDTDGAFIPDDAIVEDSTVEKPFYALTGIQTKNKTGIANRNHRKRENMNRLSATHKVWNIPYRIYYMSCNLDHALYGLLNSTDDEKENNAFAFAKKFRNDIYGFISYLCESDFSVIGGYPESWQYIREGLHSLERHTNFGLCFKAEDVDLKSESTKEE